MSKKQRMTLPEMVDYVGEHSSWLSTFQREWFQKYRDYYLKYGYLSPKQKSNLLKFACHIFRCLEGSAHSFGKRKNY